MFFELIKIYLYVFCPTYLFVIDFWLVYIHKKISPTKYKTLSS